MRTSFGHKMCTTNVFMVRRLTLQTFLYHKKSNGVAGYGITVATAILIFVSLAVFGPKSALSKERPNILLIMAEDLGSRIAAFGDQVALTPHLDALSQQGTRFTNVFTTSGVCAPSRTALVLGMHQISVGAQHMRAKDLDGHNTENAIHGTPYRAVPPPDAKAYPEYLRHGGYFTFNHKKHDFQFAVTCCGPGGGPFTIWDRDHAGSSWRDAKFDKTFKSRSFFGHISLGDTHEGRKFPNFLKKVHEGKTFPSYKIYPNYNQEINITSPESVVVPPYYADTLLIRQSLAQHYDDIHLMDRMVGKILSDLKNDGLAEDTIVIWTADHGDGLPRAKREIYDSGIKVPMIIRWPEKYRPDDHPLGGIDDRLISFVDLAPSILKMANVQAPKHLHGRALIGNKNLKPRKYIFASRDRFDEQLFMERAVRDKNFKYIRNYAPGLSGARLIAYREQSPIMAEMRGLLQTGQLNDVQKLWFAPQPEEQLYNLNEDPHEIQNLADNPKYKEIKHRLKNVLEAWRQSVGDLSQMPESAMAKMFWPKGIPPVTESPTISVDKKIITLQNKTPSASIGYKFQGTDWQLYSKPFQLAESQVITIKAVKYGWKDSEEVKFSYDPP